MFNLPFTQVELREYIDAITLQPERKCHEFKESSASMDDMADLRDPTPDNASHTMPLPNGSSQSPGTRWTKIRKAWENNLDPGERSAVWAWTAFTLTFGVVRVLTHWIRAGHGPAGGGISIGGKHFHHYNIGIGMLSGLGAVALRGTERHRHHPAAANCLWRRIGIDRR